MSKLFITTIVMVHEVDPEIYETVPDGDTFTKLTIEQLKNGEITLDEFAEMSSGITFTGMLIADEPKPDGPTNG